VPAGGLTVVCAVVAARTDADACDSNDYTAFRGGAREVDAVRLKS
jgi:hypothetical protein